MREYRDYIYKRSCIFHGITHPFHLLRAKMIQKMIESPGPRYNKCINYMYYYIICQRFKIWSEKNTSQFWFIWLSISLSPSSQWREWGRFASVSEALQSLYASFAVKEEHFLFAGFHPHCRRLWVCWTFWLAEAREFCFIYSQVFTAALLEHQDFFPTRDAKESNTWFAHTELTVVTYSSRSNPERAVCPHQLL